MARLANQLVQVLVTYATRPRTWGEIWVPLGCIAITMGVHRGDPQVFSLFAGFFAGTAFAGLVREHTRHQFAHPRAALLPDFAAAHVLGAAVFAACATLLMPALVVSMGYGNFLFMAAVASLTFAFSSARFKFIHSEIVREMFPVIVAIPILWVCLFALLLDGPRTREVPPVVSITLLAAGWAFMAVNFVRLVRLREDEKTFQASQRRPVRGRLPAAHGHLYGLALDKTWYTRNWTLSDKWNDRIGGFHHGDRLRIIRLLRHGIGPWPFEPAATCSIAFCAGCAVLFVYASTQSDFSPLWRFFPVLIALCFPASAAAEPWSRRPILGNELLRPLSREQLIDGVLGGSMWAFAVLWIPTNILALYALWSFPGLEPRVSAMMTFVFISAALGVATFGFGLYLPPRVPLALRMAINFLFIIVWSTALPWWWFARDRITDVPFWIFSALALSLGVWAIWKARRTWLNAELGVSPAH